MGIYIPDTLNIPIVGAVTVTLRQSECWRNINNPDNPDSPDSPRISNQQEYFFSLKTYFSPFSTFVENLHPLTQPYSPLFHNQGISFLIFLHANLMFHAE